MLLGAADRLMPGEQTSVRAAPGAPLFFDDSGALLSSGKGAMAVHRESAYGT